MGIPAQRNPSPQGELRVRGASNFLADPALGADVRPAFWRAEHNPSVILVALSTACEWEFETALHARTILAQAKTEAGRHIVLASMRARHRLVITHSAERDGYFVPGDRSIPIRLAALGAFHDLRGRQAVGPPAALKPTPYQRRRLALLLAILDRLEQPATVRQIAHELVLPGLGYERAIEWKTSSHRRQAQRLIAEARRMATTGYRDLLRGSMRPVLSSEPADHRDFGDNVR